MGPFRQIVNTYTHGSGGVIPEVIIGRHHYIVNTIWKNGITGLIQC